MGKLSQQTNCNKCNNSIQSGDKLATQFFKENLQFKEDGE